MSGTPTGLYDACADLLAVAVTALGGMAPERQYVSVNPPSLDCPPQITVHGGPVQDDIETGNSPTGGADGMGRMRKPSLITAELTITVAWCVSVPDQPNEILSTSVLDSEAQVVHLGGWALWNGIRSAARAEVAPFRLCKGVRVYQLLPLLAQGAAAGWVLPVTTQLDGYDLTWP